MPPAKLRRGLERLLKQQRQVCHINYFAAASGYLERLLAEGVKLILTHQGASFELMERPAPAPGRRADGLSAVSRNGLASCANPAVGRGRRCIPNSADPPLRRRARGVTPPSSIGGRLAA